MISLENNQRGMNIKNKFIATGFHGTTIESAKKILENIDYKLNKGDKFLGEGFYLWRDSYESALRWNGGGCVGLKPKDKSVIGVEINTLKDETLNFTSFNWNSEKTLIKIYLKLKSKLSFGEFIDFMIKNNVDINLVVIADLKTEPTIINVDKGIKFAQADIQMCVKNSKPISNVIEIKNED